MNSTDSTIKIHAFLASKGIASRRKAEELVAAGKVTIDGQVAKVGQRIDPKTATVMVEGKPVDTKTSEFVYFLINKPVGYVSTTSDELGRKTVLDLLPPQTERLYPVGRLDIDSEGLMLITNDGDLAYKMTHPKFEMEKTYQITLDRDISEKAFDHLYRGVRLKEGIAHIKKIEFVDADRLDMLNITITEGRNRQVRRMLERVGYDITKLVRTHMGPFTLETLGKNRYQKVEPSELQQLSL